MTVVEGCAHCRATGEDRLWEGPLFRIVLVHDTGFEGWCRIIWHEHIAEITDLPADQRQSLFDAMIVVEEALRAELRPDKMNIAALATGMPHLHVHLIPRYRDDPTFPDPVWLPAVRQSSRRLPDGFASEMRRRLREAMS